MIKVGITGGIGSGKSTACKVFQLLGIPVYYADDESKIILDDDKKVKESIIKLAGMQVLNENNLIDRKKLASFVFNDKEKLQKLNSILHPAVGAHFEDWIKAHKKYPYIVKEAAILFESGAYKQVDKVITVIAPMGLRISRSMASSGNTKEQILQRINNQVSDDEKIIRSQFVIVNDEQQLLIPQVLAIHKLLIG